MLKEQEALDLHEIEEIEKQNDIENEKWLQAEAVAMEKWKKILMKRDMLRKKEIEQQAKLKLVSFKTFLKSCIFYTWILYLGRY